MNLPAGLPKGFDKGPDKTLMILVVLEDGFATIIPIHDVVDGCPRIYAPPLARLGSKYVNAPLTIKSFLQ
ncbi:MAG TPA: hypothetical protein P5186_25660 [Candidatus Paceibacterota bacterium]|nr:hypothetical protein [Verrucomicrobiota bacterium]HRY51447.1 hypothetical protein [Candidatus Paceibacterota bacterium]